MKEFLERVDRREEVFGKGDVLVCQVRLLQWRSAAGIRAERFITRVLRHIPATGVMELPFDEPDRDDAD